MLARLARALAVAAAIGLAPAVALAQDAGGGPAYAGDAYDPVTGYRCVTPFCDTVVLPNTGCLCRKLNPDETRRDKVRYSCIDMKTRQQCAASPH